MKKSHETHLAQFQLNCDVTAGGMAPVKVDKLDYIFFLWVNQEIPIVFLDRSNVMNSNVLTL